MRINFWAQTDVGRVREHNEDNFLVDKRLNLFVVCDGMGGHAAGEVASAMSVRAVRDTIASRRDLLARLEDQPNDVPTRREVLQLVERAVLDANQQVFQSSQENEKRRGMGTTCCVLLLTGQRGFISHVGDSRVYLMRSGELHQMTEDHSLYNEMVRIGKIKPGDPINLPNKNAVTRAVGVREYVEVDVMEFDVHEHDRFLVCSDGLCGYFTSDDQVLDYMEGEDVRMVTERFIDFALDSGGRDNVTALVIDLEEGEADEDRELIADVVKSSPYFQYLSNKELEGVIELLDKRHVPASTQIFGLEDANPDLYIVLHGEIALSRNGDVFSKLQRSEHAGELGFIDAAPNDYVARTTADSVILVLERTKFMRLLRDQPALAVKLLWNFLQTFAGKLRQVPADIAFMPMLDDMALVEEEVTPIGTVVREDDLEVAVAKGDVTIPPPPALPAMPPSDPAPLVIGAQVSPDEVMVPSLGAPSSLSEETQPPELVKPETTDTDEVVVDPREYDAFDAMSQSLDDDYEPSLKGEGSFNQTIPLDLDSEEIEEIESIAQKAQQDAISKAAASSKPAVDRSMKPGISGEATVSTGVSGESMVSSGADPDPFMDNEGELDLFSDPFADHDSLADESNSSSELDFDFDFGDESEPAPRSPSHASSGEEKFDLGFGDDDDDEPVFDLNDDMSIDMDGGQLDEPMPSLDELSAATLERMAPKAQVFKRRKRTPSGNYNDISEVSEATDDAQDMRREEFVATAEMDVSMIQADMKRRDAQAAKAAAEDGVREETQKLRRPDPAELERDRARMNEEVSESTEMVPKPDIDELRRRDRKNQGLYESSVEEHEL